MKQTWLVRPVPHGTNRIEEFRAQNIIAIGWPELQDLTGFSREGLKALLAQAPYGYSGLALGNAYATIDIFVNQMHPGDLVLVANGDDIYFAEITSKYQFNDAHTDDGYPHQRTVKWLLPASISRQTLSKELRSSLKVHRTTANLSHHEKEIEALAAGKAFAREAEKDISISYPLRPDYSVSFTIPSDISKSEAERLSIYFRSIYFTE